MDPGNVNLGNSKLSTVDAMRCSRSLTMNLPCFICATLPRQAVKILSFLFRPGKSWKPYMCPGGFQGLRVRIHRRFVISLEPHEGANWSGFGESTLLRDCSEASSERPVYAQTIPEEAFC